MESEYDRRQRSGMWPSRGRWNPDGLPDWYIETLTGLAGNLTAWRDHDPGQRLDPRCDPRCPRHRARHAAYGRDHWMERRKAEVLAELRAADRRHQADREGRHAHG